MLPIIFLCFPCTSLSQDGFGQTFSLYLTRILIRIICVISLGSENGERRARPRSEFIQPMAEYHVPFRKSQARPQSMDIEALYERNNASRTSSNEIVDRNSLNASENLRKISVTSSKSTGLLWEDFPVYFLIGWWF